jgi:hypothetical protein
MEGPNTAREANKVLQSFDYPFKVTLPLGTVNRRDHTEDNQTGGILRAVPAFELAISQAIFHSKDFFPP